MTPDGYRAVVAFQSKVRRGSKLDGINLTPRALRSSTAEVSRYTLQERKDTEERKRVKGEVSGRELAQDEADEQRKI